MSGLWPWLALVGLGAYHGLNPAMGWLFAVALGLHRGRWSVVLESLLPIALGHALSVLLVAGAVVAFGLVVSRSLVQAGAGLLLIGWAGYHRLYGSRHRVRVGLRTGMVGLAVWSFLMATAHGAGLMLVPVLIPLCLAATPGRELLATGQASVALAALGVHTLSMLAVTAAVATAVYGWVGVAVLRRAWVNLDLLWSAALLLTGVLLLVLAWR
jgi:hypothetical protein